MAVWRFRAYLYLCSGLAACLVLAFSATLKRQVVGLPSIASLDGYKPSLTTRVTDVGGRTLAELFTERRALLPLSEIPVDLQSAVIAVEDAEFFRHWGISVKGIFRAAVKNFRARRVVQGGSTITQQLSKMIFLTKERTISRKIKEALLALQIEGEFSKQEILQMYLNQIYFGHGAYGVEAAAKIYFGKEVAGLTLGECALLAGFIRAPSHYSPFSRPGKARARRYVVLYRMVQEKFITVEEGDEALKEAIPTERPPIAAAHAPYFVEHVRREVEPKYGYSALWKGGLRIRTTLDLDIQEKVERILEEKLKKYDQDVVDYRLEHPEPGMELVVVSTEITPIQGAFVVLDARSGAIRAMVGGRDFKAFQFNRATQAYRQPGSTFKPFVWTTALQSGYTPASLVEDTLVAYYYDGMDWRLLRGATEQFAVSLATSPFILNKDFNIWVPTDFDNKFLGVITLRRALEASRNIVSVRLIEHVGPPRVVDLARRAGIGGYLSPVLSLGLGTSVVSLLELTGAFGTFANAGIHVESFAVSRVEDSEGRLLDEYVPREKEVISPQVAFIMANLLKGVVRSGTGRRARRLKRPIAGKTGTSQGNRDVWFVGFTPHLVAGVWMGYDDFSPMVSGWTGSAVAVQFWTDVMEEVLKEYPVEDFHVPDGVSFVKIDMETGKRALPTCPNQRLEVFLKGTEPEEFCDADHAKPLELKPSFSE